MHEYYQEIRPYREYVDFMEDFLQKEANKSNSFIELYEGLTSYDEITPLDIKYETEEFNKITGYFEELYFTHSIKEFSNVLRRSLFVNLYAFLEKRMLKICREAGNKDEIRLSLSDLRGSGIEKAKTYLTKVVGIPFDLCQDWEEIQKFKTLRHCVAHNEGKIDDGFNDKGGNLKKYVKSKDTLSLDLDKTVRFEKEFCVEALDVIERFLETLNSRLK